LGHPEFSTAADDIMHAAEAGSAALNTSELTGDDYRIFATGHIDDSATFTFTVKLTRLELSNSGEESYKVGW
jgi:hypothetical protein